MDSWLRGSLNDESVALGCCMARNWQPHLCLLHLVEPRVPGQGTLHKGLQLLHHSPLEHHRWKSFQHKCNWINKTKPEDDTSCRVLDIILRKVSNEFYKYSLNAETLKPLPRNSVIFSCDEWLSPVFFNSLPCPVGKCSSILSNTRNIFPDVVYSFLL